MRKISFLPLGLLLVSVTVLFLIVPARAETASQTNVLLICIDTLRADHMPIHGYERDTTPAITAFFSDAAIFESAYTPNTSTAQSVTSMLTGLIPQRHGVRYFYQIVPDGLVTVADILRDAGYQAAAVVSNMVLTDEACGLAKHFDDYDDFVDQKQLYENIYERIAGPTTDAAVHWLSESRDPGRPFFLYVHYMDPHGPYHPPEDKPVEFTHDRPFYVPPTAISEDQRHPGVTDVREYVDLYDEEIAYTDREVGRLLDFCTGLGLADDSLVILTADHGERLTELRPRFDRPAKEGEQPVKSLGADIVSALHGYYPRELFKHSDGVEQEQARVPLLVRGGGFRKARVTTPVSLIDVTPTILQYAGLEIPEGLDGRPLSDPLEGRLIFIEGYVWDRRSVIQGSRKWSVALAEDESVLREWYCDLDSDPSEDGLEPWPDPEPATTALMDLIWTDPLRPGKQRPAGLVKGEKLTAPKTRPSLIAPGVSEEDRERLRKIGYH